MREVYYRGIAYSGIQWTPGGQWHLYDKYTNMIVHKVWENELDVKSVVSLILERYYERSEDIT